MTNRKPYTGYTMVSFSVALSNLFEVISKSSNSHGMMRLLCMVCVRLLSSCIRLFTAIDLYISGYGVFTTTNFDKGDFLLDYAGVLRDENDSMNKPDQTYIYYFRLGSHYYR